jgi:hypothetical protein
MGEYSIDAGKENHYFVLEESLPFHRALRYEWGLSKRMGTHTEKPTITGLCVD